MSEPGSLDELANHDRHTSQPEFQQYVSSAMELDSGDSEQSSPEAALPSSRMNILAFPAVAPPSRPMAKLPSSSSSSRKSAGRTSARGPGPPAFATPATPETSVTSSVESSSKNGSGKRRKNEEPYARSREIAGSKDLFAGWCVEKVCQEPEMDINWPDVESFRLKSKLSDASAEHPDPAYVAHFVKKMNEEMKSIDPDVTEVLPTLAFYFWQLETSTKHLGSEACFRKAIDSMLHWALSTPGGLLQVTYEMTLDLPNEKARSGHTCIADTMVTATCPSRDNSAISLYKKTMDVLPKEGSSPVNKVHSLLFPCEHKRGDPDVAYRQLTFDLYNAQRQRSRLGLPARDIYGMTCLKGDVSVFPSRIIIPDILFPQVHIPPLAPLSFQLLRPHELIKFYRFLRFGLRPILESIAKDDRSLLSTPEYKVPALTLPPPPPPPPSPRNGSSNGGSGPRDPRSGNDNQPRHAPNPSGNAPPPGRTTSSAPWTPQNAFHFCDSPNTMEATLYEMIIELAQNAFRHFALDDPELDRKLSSIRSELWIAWAKHCQAEKIDVQDTLFERCLQAAWFDAQDHITRFRKYRLGIQEQEFASSIVDKPPPIDGVSLSETHPTATPVCADHLEAGSHATECTVNLHQTNYSPETPDQPVASIASSRQGVLTGLLKPMCPQRAAPSGNDDKPSLDPEDVVLPWLLGQSRLQTNHERASESSQSHGGPNLFSGISHSQLSTEQLRLVSAYGQSDYDPHHMGTEFLAQLPSSPPGLSTSDEINAGSMPVHVTPNLSKDAAGRSQPDGVEPVQVVETD